MHSALVLHEESHVATTRLVWTAVILSCSETSAVVTQLSAVYKYNLLGAKRGFARTPPAYGPDHTCLTYYIVPVMLMNGPFLALYLVCGLILIHHICLTQYTSF